MKKIFAAMLVSAVTALTGQAGAAETVYIPLGSAGEVLVVDAQTDKVIGQIKDLPDVHGLAATPDGRLLIAASYSETAADAAAPPPKPAGMPESEHEAHHGAAPMVPQGGMKSIVSVIDASTGTIVRRIEVPGAAHHVATTPDGRYAILTHPNAGQVSVIDLMNYALTATVHTGPSPNYVAVNPEGTQVFVSNAGNDTISELDPERWIVRRNIVAGKSPEHLVLSHDARRLYVANVNDGTVSEIDTQGGSVMRTFKVGGFLHGLDLSDDGRRIFVTARERNELVAINTHTLDVTRTPLGPAPYHAAAVTGTGKLYVSSAEEPKVWVIDQASLRLLGEIPIRGEGHQMAVVPH